MKDLPAIVFIAVCVLTTVASSATFKADCRSEYITDKIPYKWKIVCRGHF